ncbi:hypothetical protein [uncultured Empedobacter sp.]|uniref:hypothetical protein n=1 Tax=uncultured Empedobacter sp. TaxID=410844 RepID=UPI0025CED09B|nr:hypothetical protein [uncultured Empedobacter sp.]
MKKVKSLPNHYSTIDHLTLYRWDRYTNTKDNNWFLVDYDGRHPKITCPELIKVEESLQDQYFNAVDDRSFSLKIQKWAKIGYLKQKYEIVDALLHRMWMGFGDDFEQMETRLLIIKQLRLWGFKFPELNSVESDKELIINFRKSLEGISTQIALLANELKEDGHKQTKNLYAQIVIAKSALQGYEMNPRIMVVSEWIEICKQVQEIAKKN